MRDASLILLPIGKKPAVSIRVVTPLGLKDIPSQLRNLAKGLGFEAGPMSILLCPDASGSLTDVVVGAPAAGADPFTLGGLAARLPAGHYKFTGKLDNPHLAALGWCLELYRYDPFRPAAARATTLEVPKNASHADVIAEANATYEVRDMVNAPANILGPTEIEAAAHALARRHHARFTVTRGKTLQRNFPLVHIVGAASPRSPRLIDFTWGNSRHPKITLVGKGVCFDTGGLDIKPSSGMLLMKKDMGGAATVLGLARLIMERKLPVRLRVLIPAVENAISGVAFRPGDVFKTRKGLTVEIGNTDAEGRLVLCEALAFADEEKPDMIIDMATLTGAARVALGPDLPPFYTDDDSVANAVMKHAMAVNDPLWRLPLWKPYMQMIETPLADLNNSGAAGFAGSITAALFLRRFVEHAKHHLHLDIFAWVPNAKPGRPKGGEAQGLRAIYSFLAERYGK